jgi:hypothetical protein
MQSRYCLALIICLMLLVYAPAMAEFSPVDDTPQERFTQSMLAVYAAAEMCKNVSNLNSENLATRIKTYLRSYFQEGVPYWALPPIDKAIRNRESCINLIQESIARYQAGRRQYAESYPNSPTPPALYYSMVLEGNAENLNSGNAESPKEHVITPKLLAR